MFNYLFNRTFLIGFIFLLTACASEPITVLKTEYGKVISERIIPATESSALATVGGAVLGGVLGNQIGGGTGQDIATGVGVIAGGAAANQATKKEVVYYRYEIRMDNGASLTKDTGKNRHRVGDTVVLETLSNGSQRINIL